MRSVAAPADWAVTKILGWNRGTERQILYRHRDDMFRAMPFVKLSFHPEKTRTAQLHYICGDTLALVFDRHHVSF